MISVISPFRIAVQGTHVALRKIQKGFQGQVAEGRIPTMIIGNDNRLVPELPVSLVSTRQFGVIVVHKIPCEKGAK